MSMRNPSPTPPNSSARGAGPTSWRGHKDLAKRQFEAEDYNSALSSYRAALRPEYNCPRAEQQILLSNVVACRLKIGGRPMASAAVEEAKQCIAINDKWSKGHVRLASAYIALGDHSNDACNALQRALALDPGNATARQMLLGELRRDRVQRAASSVSASAGAAEPSAPPADEDEEPPPRQPDEAAAASEVPPPQNPGYVPDGPDRTFASSSYSQSAPSVSSSTTSSGSGTNPPPPNDYMGSPTAPHPPPRRDDNSIDESLTWSQRIQFHFARLTTWYHHALTDDARTLIKVILGLLVLYVAFGGRFGIDTLLGSKHENRGNYERGNAYDRFYGRGGGVGETTGYNDRQGSYSTGSSSYQSRRTSSHDDYNDYSYQPRSRSTPSSQGFHFPNLFDGSLPSMICLAAVAYLCHRNGVNPFHAIYMMNLFAGGRGRGRHMQGMGMAGLGYGMYQNQFGRRGMYGGRRGRAGG